MTLRLPRLPVARNRPRRSLAQRCLDAKAADPDADVSAWEQEIDEIVAGLYGL